MLLLLAQFACTPEEKPSEDDTSPAVVDDCPDGEREWWPDGDGDGYGANGSSIKSCADKPGFATQTGDCDDGEPTVNPAAAEECNLRDDNCDGVKDDTNTTWYTDADADGYGDDSTAIATCEPPAGTVETGGDCDDSLATVHPGAEEACNALDDDCDGTADLGYEAEWHSDDDGDGYGHPYIKETTCVPQVGWVLDGSDCRPSDAGGFPGAAETCNGVDDSCDGVTDEGFDDDGDGHQDSVCPDGDDCDDTRADTYLGAVERCESGYDEDCDGEDKPCGYAGSYDLASEADAIVLSNSLTDVGRLVDAGDVDGDGDDDILLAALYSSGGFLVESPVSGSVNAEDVATTHKGDGAVIYGSGRSIGMADVNEDGLVDIGFGSPYGGEPGLHVVYGPADADSDLSDADYHFDCQPSEYCGHGAYIADVSGDGVGDAIVGAYADSYSGRSLSGTVWVEYGPLSGETDYEDADATLGGESANIYTGRFIRGGGDHNGDGIGDIVIAAPYTSVAAYYGGSLYVVYGPPSGEMDLGDADGRVSSEYANAYLGEMRTMGQGDVDGDGLADLIAGTTGGNGGRGAAFMVLGPVSGDHSESTADLTITGSGGAFGGSPLAEDIDGNGAADIAIGAYSSGDAYLFYNVSIGSSLTDADADATFSGAVYSGAGLAFGDFNGDGTRDLAIGSMGLSANKGGVYTLLNYL